MPFLVRLIVSYVTICHLYMATIAKHGHIIENIYPVKNAFYRVSIHYLFSYFPILSGGDHRKRIIIRRWLDLVKFAAVVVSVFKLSDISPQNSCQARRGLWQHNNTFLSTFMTIYELLWVTMSLFL